MVRTILFLCLVFFPLVSCSNDGGIGDNRIRIISYNVQNFFDGSECGNEYDDFKVANGWDKAAFDSRVASFLLVLKQPPFSSADIILFQEVESEAVLEALLDNGMRKRGFIYYGIADNNTPVSVAYISKINPIAAHMHASSGQRGVLALEFFLSGEQFFLFSVHAKSQSGGVDATEGERLALSSLLQCLVSETLGSAFLITGDFNTDPGLQYDEVRSLMRPGVYSEDEIWDFGALPVCGEKKMVSAKTLYAPTIDMALPLSAEGTYYYDGAFTFLDHALCSEALFDGVGLEYSAFAVLNESALKREGGVPYSFDKNSGRGYSDHFAIQSELVYAGR